MVSLALLAAGLIAVPQQTQFAEAAVTQTVLFDKGGPGYGCYRIPAIVCTGSSIATTRSRSTWTSPKYARP